VSAVPFASVFNTGHGLRWYEEGQVTSDAAWNHLGLQDRLPSRRWAVRTAGTRPTVTFDFADAWRGGSSVLVAGDPDQPVVLDLYTTRLPISAGTVVELTYRTDAGNVDVELAVATAEPDGAGTAPPYTCLPVDAGDGWSTATVPLTGLSGTIHALGVRLTASAGPVRWRLGGIAVRDAVSTPGAPTAPRITAASGGDLRLAWDPAPGAVRHHTLHRLLPDGSRRFLGATGQRAFYLTGLQPEQGEETARFEVRAVGELYTSSDPVTVTHTW
ncbi:endo-beta-N-acetylglucosaminidase, partial [Streptomyces sp. NPDC005921]